jgi:hypothetical protein
MHGVSITFGTVSNVLWARPVMDEASAIKQRNVAMACGYLDARVVNLDQWNEPESVARMDEQPLYAVLVTYGIWADRTYAKCGSYETAEALCETAKSKGYADARIVNYEAFRKSYK